MLISSAHWLELLFFAYERKISVFDANVYRLCRRSNKIYFTSNDVNSDDMDLMRAKIKSRIAIDWSISIYHSNNMWRLRRDFCWAANISFESVDNFN